MCVWVVQINVRQEFLKFDLLVGGACNWCICRQQTHHGLKWASSPTSWCCSASTGRRRTMRRLLSGVPRTQGRGSLIYVGGSHRGVLQWRPQPYSGEPCNIVRYGKQVLEANVHWLLVNVRVLCWVKRLTLPRLRLPIFWTSPNVVASPFDYQNLRRNVDCLIELGYFPFLNDLLAKRLHFMPTTVLKFGVR